MTQEIQQSSHWQIDHRGGLIRSLSVKIDGVMRQVPMRQDQYGGICWIIAFVRLLLSVTPSCSRNCAWIPAA